MGEREPVKPHFVSSSFPPSCRGANTTEAPQPPAGASDTPAHVLQVAPVARGCLSPKRRPASRPSPYPSPRRPRGPGPFCPSPAHSVNSKPTCRSGRKGTCTSQQCTCKAHTPASDPSAEIAASPAGTRSSTGPELRRSPCSGDSNLEGTQASLPDCSLSWLLICIFITISLFNQKYFLKFSVVPVGAWDAEQLKAHGRRGRPAPPGFGVRVALCACLHTPGPPRSSPPLPTQPLPKAELGRTAAAD